MELKIKHNSFGTLGSSKISEIKPLVRGSFEDYEDFYAEVYKQMFHSLFSYGMQLCGNKELTKDCIQELFSELWKNQKTLNKVKHIKSYLFKSYNRKIIRELNKGKQLRIEGSFQFETSHEIKLINDEQILNTQRSLSRALELLTSRQREAIYLRFYENLTYEEVGQILNIKTKAVYKLIYRSLSSLKELI